MAYVYFSLYTRWQHISNGYTYVFGVQLSYGSDDNVVRPNGEKPEVENPCKMVASKLEISVTQLVHKMAEKATPTFSGLSNMAGIIRTLFDVGVSGKLKMAAITGSTVFDLPLTPMSESVHTSFVCWRTSKMWVKPLELCCNFI